MFAQVNTKSEIACDITRRDRLHRSSVLLKRRYLKQTAFIHTIEGWSKYEL